MTSEQGNDSQYDQGVIRGTIAVFSMKQAAEVAGVSVSTLRRRRGDLVAAGADISPEGWKVPMTALVACGLIAGEGSGALERPIRPQPHLETDQVLATQAKQVEELTNQIRDLEHEVSEWRRRAEVAEARAEERGRALDALQVANEAERMALRMLTAGNSNQGPIQRAEQPSPHAESSSPASALHDEQTRENEVLRQGPQHREQASSTSRRKGFLSRVMGF